MYVWSLRETLVFCVFIPLIQHIEPIMKHNNRIDLTFGYEE